MTTTRISSSPWWVGGILAGMVAMGTATADEDLAAGVIGAVVQNPDCVGATIANQAIQEGLKRGGRQLLNRFGIQPGRNAAPVPCEPSQQPSSETTAAAPAAAPAPAAASAATAPTAEQQGRRRGGGLFSGALQGNSGQNRRNCGALGAGCADGMKPLVACLNEISFWGEMALHVENKRNTGNWTAEQLAQIDEDLAALRAAGAAGANRVTPADPSRPDRHFEWLTPEEYSAAASAVSQKINAHTQECNRKYAKF